MSINGKRIDQFNDNTLLEEVGIEYGTIVCLQDSKLMKEKRSAIIDMQDKENVNEIMGKFVEYHQLFEFIELYK